MPRCSKIKKKKQQVCIGDLRDEIVIQDRDIAPPLSGVDFRELFTNDKIRQAMINTINGKTFFDGVNTDILITHEILFRFDESVTAENWILLDTGNQLDILRITNLDERSDWMMATCVDRGTKVASQA